MKNFELHSGENDAENKEITHNASKNPEMPKGPETMTINTQEGLSYNLNNPKSVCRYVDSINIENTNVDTMVEEINKKLEPKGGEISKQYIQSKYKLGLHETLLSDHSNKEVREFTRSMSNLRFLADGKFSNDEKFVTSFVQEYMIRYTEEDNLNARLSDDDSLRASTLDVFMTQLLESDHPEYHRAVVELYIKDPIAEIENKKTRTKNRRTNKRTKRA